MSAPALCWCYASLANLEAGHRAGPLFLLPKKVSTPVSYVIGEAPAPGLIVHSSINPRGAAMTTQTSSRMSVALTACIVLALYGAIIGSLMWSTKQAAAATQSPPIEIEVAELF